MLPCRPHRHRPRKGTSCNALGRSTVDNQGRLHRSPCKYHMQPRKTGASLIARLTAPIEAREERIEDMKHLLTGVAMVAALAFSAPVWAQPANPSGGNALGLPGPNPGGPGLTPYSSGPRTTAAPPPSASAPAMAPSAMPPSSMSDTSSAMPPKHRASRHALHGKPSHHPSRFSNVQGNVANQLNQEELGRLQAGNMSMPAAPPPPGMAPPPRSPGLPPQGGSSGAGPR